MLTLKDEVAKRKERYEKNKCNPEFIEKKKDLAKKDYLKNRDKYRHNNKKWYLSLSEEKREERRSKARLKSREPESKEYQKSYKLKNKYGLTLEEYNRLYLLQDGKCDICKKSQVILCLDHCHTTNKIRGLLCKSCNLGIGNLKDSLDLLESAKQYLLKHANSK